MRKLKNNSDFGNFLPAMRCVPIEGNFTYMVRCAATSANPAKRGRWGWPGGQIDLLPGAQGFAEPESYTLLREGDQELRLRIRETTTPLLVENRRIYDGKHAGKIMLTYASVSRDFDILPGEIDPENDATGWFALEQLATMKDITPVTGSILNILPEFRELPKVNLDTGLLLQ